MVTRPSLAASSRKLGQSAGWPNRSTPISARGLSRPSRPHRRDPPREAARIDLEGARIDIHEHRRRAQHERHLGGRGVGEGGQEHGVTGADPLGHQGDLDGVGAGTHADAVLGATERREFLLKLRDLRPKNELAMRQHRIQPLAQDRRDPRLLGFQIEERRRS